MSAADTLAPSRVRTPANSSNGVDPTMGAVAGEVSTVSPGLETSNLSYIETLYHEYLKSPDLVSPDWRNYFRDLVEATRSSDLGGGSTGLFKAPQLADGLVSPVELDARILQERVDRLMRNYRVMGHFAAEIDPLGMPRPVIADLDPKSCGFTEDDLERQFSTLTASGPNVRSLREILSWLRNTYCRSIGVQFMHIDDLKVREWLQNRMEATENRIQLTTEQRQRILKRLCHSVVFEEFILKKFQGAKSFSLEGGETLIPLLELAIDKVAEDGVNEIVFAMAHRGRLNVLAGIMGKSPRAIFREFADLDPQLHEGRGDVKYHLGYSNDWYTPTGKKVHLSLCFNPSHLEFANPVAMGRVRAKQDRKRDLDRRGTMCVMIHGDASFSGEGISQEVLNLSGLDATRVGGTLHVIVNNQIGFTTGPNQGRCTDYASDVAKMLQIPIFHVNGEDPEAVAQVVYLATEFRKEFQRDVVIDMYCFRRRGHNEQDEPRFTSPLMYRIIDERRPVYVSYLEHLNKQGNVERADVEQIITDHRQQLELEHKIATGDGYVHNWNLLQGIWRGYQGGPEFSVPDVPTGIPREQLAALLEIQTRVPEGFHPHPKLIKSVIEARREMAAGNRPIDFGGAEAMAFASLLTEGHPIRLHGQDCERGTFSHRHAVLHDVDNGTTYTPLQHLAADQAPLSIYNSCLSEAGVLGYEYGYSLDCPEGLICWEAQFGDFVNVAQVIIDQFISSAEDKWSRLSGLVMLLPHGFEGAGPEHSSARLERFLQIAAEDNLQVVYPTTSAQYFHLLRRQVKRPWRKPLVVMTPKKYLRAPESSATIDELATGSFRRVIPDVGDRPKSQIREILLCSGKVYYDLASRRDELQRQDVAIIRVEQLYPLPFQELNAQLKQYPDSTPVAWVQEEPHNMGAWWFILAHWGATLMQNRKFRVVARPASASPATGSKHSHEIEQLKLLEEAFAM